MRPVEVGEAGGTRKVEAGFQEVGAGMGTSLMMHWAEEGLVERQRYNQITLFE